MAAPLIWLCKTGMETATEVGSFVSGKMMGSGAVDTKHTKDKASSATVYEQQDTGKQNTLVHADLC